MPGGQYPVILAGQDLDADTLQALTEYEAWKTGTTSRASVVSLAADPDLVIPVAANAAYDVSGVLGYTAGGPISSGGAGGIDFTLTAPAGSSGGFTATGWQLGSSLAMGIFPFTAFGTGHALNGNGATTCAAIVTGTLITGTAAGSLALSWAQAGASGTATVLLAGCRLAVKRIG